MDIYFLRHGETLWNSLDKIQGQKNTLLSAKGKEQALLTYTVKHEYPK